MDGVWRMMSVTGRRSSCAMAMYMRGIRGKWNAMWHSSPAPKYSCASSGHWLASASSILPGYSLSMTRRMRRRMAWVSGRFSLLVPSRSTR
ncbi:Uncharacterised protein [Bordetella pertussis]|nr:Uncharacterised protein [Bordetella pertussis]CFO00321.1 Uncharacterised protein [Bordetella pertussis]CFP05054.1 Uncharacterised protein [Bordetella pertussis]CPI72944.1 Uncharacterised protein [Bordetella pertussis]CPO56981.1 Uncharacterised protein [Bordetella pertussis]